MFASSVLTLFTGMVFTSFVARSLPVSEYGVWFFISTSLAYFQFFQGLVPFWAFRDCSRGYPVERTCVVSNALLSVPFLLIYIAMAPAFANAIGSQQGYFYLSSLFIPIYFVESGFNAIITAKLPHKLAYRNMIMDFFKLVSIIWLIELGLSGVVLCIITAYCIYLCFAFYTTKDFMRDKFDLARLKRWLSSSWIVLYGNIGSGVYGSLDTLLIGILGSMSALGLYGVALTAAGLLRLPGNLSSALYAKLLSEEAGKKEHIKETVMLTLMFLVPMTVGCYLLASNLIDFFGSKYLDGLPALYFLLPGYFIGALGEVLNPAISAAEKVDLEERISTIKLVRSNLFFLSSMGYLNAIISAPLMLFLIPKYNIVGCAIVITTTSIINFLIKCLKFNVLKVISYRRVVKFLFASFVMSVFVALVYSRGAINTVLIIFSGGIVYLATLSITDKQTRNLASKVLIEIRTRTRRLKKD